MKQSRNLFIAGMLIAILALTQTTSFAAGFGRGMRTPSLGRVRATPSFGRSMAPRATMPKVPALPRGRSRMGGPGFSRTSIGLPGLGRSGFPMSSVGPRWHGSSYRYRDSYSRAYRDVGLAAAAVGLVGVMAHAATAPQYVYVAPPPAPVAVHSGGAWVRQPVVVQPARHEEYQVWVPEVYDTHTGLKISGGFYETRTRVVPQVVEYQNVWVVP